MAHVILAPWSDVKKQERSARRMPEAALFDSQLAPTLLKASKDLMHASTDTSASSRTRPTLRSFDGVRIVLRGLDAFLSAVESAVWELRLAAEDFARAARHDASSAREGLAEASSRLARLTQTSASLSLVAGSYRLGITKSAFITRAAAARSMEALHRKNAVRIREVSEQHGGALLKVGQILSSRPDVLPAAYIEELAVLQDAAPRVPFELVRPNIELELAESLEAAFATFDEEPIAAASIGQVHRATLADGREVAVKVQRPGIAPLVSQDLDLLELFIEAVAPMLPPMDMATIARAVRATVERELDFEAEARDGTAIAEGLASMDTLIVPRVIEECSTGRVLTTSFVRGRKITIELDELAAKIEEGSLEAAARRDEILGTLLECYVRQILELGIFQADPHPGNLLVTEEGALVLLDFGSTQRLSPESRQAYLELVMSFVGNDTDGVASACDKLGFRTKSGKHETLQRFSELLLGSFAMHAGSARFPSKEELAAEARAVLDAMGNDPVEVIPDDFVMIARVFGTLAGMFLRYRPDIDVSARVMPVLIRAMAH